MPRCVRGRIGTDRYRTLWLVVVAAAVLTSAAGCSGNDAEPAGPEGCVPSSPLASSSRLGPNELLDDPSWGSTPGATPTAGGIHVHFTGRAIVNKDGSAGGPNDPVNYAALINTDGTFDLTARLVDIHASAVIQLYGKVPVILDEHRYDPASVRINLQGDRLLTDSWKCADQDTVSLRTAGPIAAQSQHTLSLRDADGRLGISVDGQDIETIDDAGIGATHELWLGLDSNEPGGSFNLVKLQLEPAASSQHLTISRPLDNTYVHKSPDGLQQLVAQVRPGFRIGAAVSIGPLASDPGYQRTLVDNFGQLITENAGKPQFVEPRPGRFFFGEEDQLAQFARQNGMTLHGHTAVFGEADPLWMTRLASSDPKQMLTVMKDLIRHDVTQNVDVMTSYDVVDEPQSDYSDQMLRPTIWLKSIGPRYLPIAFRTAHRANPTLELDWNDYGLEADNQRWHNFYRYLRHLVLVEHVPIDGVGFESHIYEHGDQEDPNILRSHIEALAKLDIVSRISEIDVETGDGADFQSQQFSGVLDACLQEPTCLSYTTWSVNNKYGSTSSVDANGYHPGTGYLFDQHNKPVPAYHALQNLLSAMPRETHE